MNIVRWLGWFYWCQQMHLHCTVENLTQKKRIYKSDNLLTTGPIFTIDVIQTAENMFDRLDVGSLLTWSGCENIHKMIIASTYANPSCIYKRTHSFFPSLWHRNFKKSIDSYIACFLWKSIKVQKGNTTVNDELVRNFDVKNTPVEAWIN